MRITKRDMGLTLLFLIGFGIAYAEGYGIMLATQRSYPDAWSGFPTVFMLAFGIFHSMFLFRLFAGGRFSKSYRLSLEESKTND